MSRNYSEKREERQTYERRRQKTRARREQKLGYQTRAREANPAKYKARMWVNNAIRDGRLIRGVCEVVGCPSKAEAHHEDYSKPYEVRWCCRKHHRALHGQVAD